MFEAIKWRLYWVLFKAAFFILNRKPSLRENLASLRDKTFYLLLEGHPKPFVFRINQKGYIVDSPQTDSPDVIVGGHFSTFWRILWGKVDVDSAFFHRKITIQGNLAMALNLKNVLDNFLFFVHQRN